MALPQNLVGWMEYTLRSLQGTRPRLLLHACCAPCSSAVLEQLTDYFEITILYYNPNIWPPEEYRRRADELQRFLAAAQHAGVTLVEDEYDPQEFYTAVQGLEHAPEKGDRCTVCYRLRMERAARYAKEHGYEWFTTTLSISPKKDAAKVNAIGSQLAQQYGLNHLTNDFKKRGGYNRSLALSDEYGLYRQDYCGCEFSARGAAKTAPPACPHD